MPTTSISRSIMPFGGLKPIRLVFILWLAGFFINTLLHPPCTDRILGETFVGKHQCPRCYFAFSHQHVIALRRTPFLLLPVRSYLLLEALYRQVLHCRKNIKTITHCFDRIGKPNIYQAHKAPGPSWLRLQPMPRSRENEAILLQQWWKRSTCQDCKTA